jgi:hypothetical protein
MGRVHEPRSYHLGRYVLRLGRYRHDIAALIMKSPNNDPNQTFRYNWAPHLVAGALLPIPVAVLLGAGDWVGRGCWAP